VQTHTHYIIYTQTWHFHGVANSSSPGPDHVWWRPTGALEFKGYICTHHLHVSGLLLLQGPPQNLQFTGKVSCISIDWGEEKNPAKGVSPGKTFSGW